MYTDIIETRLFLSIDKFLAISGHFNYLEDPKSPLVHTHTLTVSD